MRKLASFTILVIIIINYYQLVHVIGQFQVQLRINFNEFFLK